MDHFIRWCSASEVDNYVDLCNLIVLEQFRCSLPAHLATYINEKEVKTAAAVLADEYILTHASGSTVGHKSTKKRFRFRFKPSKSPVLTHESAHQGIRGIFQGQVADLIQAGCVMHVKPKVIGKVNVQSVTLAKYHLIPVYMSSQLA